MDHRERTARGGAGGGYGNLHIRALADVDRKARLEVVRALLHVREEFRGILDIQVVPSPRTGSCASRAHPT